MKKLINCRSITAICLVLLLFHPFFAFGQAVSVSGIVKDAKTGEAIPGVSIIVKGTTKGTLTGIDGKYAITVENPQAVLVFSFVGYNTAENPVNGRSVIDVSMTETATQLGEVVVIGYGTQKKSDLTGAIAVVNTKEVVKAATNDVTKALQGKVAGLSIQSGGEPGAVPLVKLRGVSSFNNSTPLYIIDGVPTPVNDYPMSDIETIQVLKDASAAAIYGSRAANGVIIITTKRGQKGKMKIDYSGYIGVQNIAKRYDVTNAKDYQKLVNLATYNAKMTMASYTGDTLPMNNPKDPRFSKYDTDWQKECEKTGVITEHNISLSGGSDKSTYNTSFNYFNQTGTMVGNGPNYKRYSFTVNSDHNYGKLKFGESMNYTYVDNDLMSFVKDGTAVSFMVEAIPTLPIYDPTTIDGYSASNKVLDGSYTANVIGMNKMIESNSKRYKFIGNAYAEYSFFPYLKYKLSLTFDRSDFKDYHFDPVHNLGWAYVNSTAKMNDNRSAAQTGTIEQTLTFDKKIGDHTINAMIGTSALDFKYSYTNAYAEGFSQPYFKEISNGATTTSLGGENESRLVSYFGRLIYNFQDKYLLTASIRRDGSTRFAPSKRWGDFPSVAVGWKINNESFLKDVASINLLKIRASWGKLGNQEIGDYMYQSAINPYASYIFGGTLNSGSAQISYKDPSIHWESKETKNIGIDGEFFNNRLSFSAEYYYSKSSDMLLTVKIPYSNGVYSWLAPTINGATASNKGFEFTAGWRDRVGEVSYSISGNLSTLKNKILSLGYGNNPIYGTISKSEVGTSIGALYGWVIDGIFQNQSDINTLNAAAAAKYGAGSSYQNLYTSPGDYKFKDLNNDGIINDKDRTYLGKSIPDLYFGLNITASYKIFDFSVAGNGVSGNKIFNAIRASLEYGGAAEQYSTRMLNSWTPSNKNTDVPRVVMNDPNGNSRNSSRWLEDGRYFKITNVELGVTLPSELLKKAKISNLRMYVKGQNLYTFTKYTGFDPDFGSDGMFDRAVDHGSYPNKAFTAFSGGLPNPRTFIVGVQLGF
ncbi:MAG: TonB-dependent receptor [Bacteroidota bacterium]|nr:TonB-dependent receptor [Bacteroidota bacterium]